VTSQRLSFTPEIKMTPALQKIYSKMFGSDAPTAEALELMERRASLTKSIVNAVDKLCSDGNDPETVQEALCIGIAAMAYRAVNIGAPFEEIKTIVLDDIGRALDLAHRVNKIIDACEAEMQRNDGKVQ
jgi:hypothetical protein